MDFSTLRNFNFHQKFLTSLFAGGDGTISCTRVVMMMLITFIVGMGTVLVTKVHQTVTVPDLVMFLQGAGTFVMTTCGPLYLINKGGDVLNKKSDASFTTLAADGKEVTKLDVHDQ